MQKSGPSIGQLAELACTWEVRARKAGNVCPGREFADLTVHDFLVSGAAIAPVLDEAPHQPLGITILRCIEATRKVVATNTNLGIVLLLAPLASVPLDQPLMPGLHAVLHRTTAEDARNAYVAIRLAQPGGMGKVKEQDIDGEPTLPLRDVMALAKERDSIANEFDTDFSWVHAIACGLARNAKSWQSVEKAIVEAHLFRLSDVPDSLIRRKLGEAEARRVSDLANAFSEDYLDLPWGRQAFRDFDAFLRSDNHARNPGTTADLIAAALFVALRENWIATTMPFEWKDHPFGSEA